ncbi:MAG TPA: complex I NDUFA9 subunit family protein [Burkholderiaceae bacterium]|nr:complex I NDUFA9 subunit family protein [Burkholderiaceae bacterium]
MARRAVVLGGTGFIGRAFAWRCAAHGLSINLTLPSRNPSGRRCLLTLPGVDVLRADVHDEPSLARLFAGADAVVNLVGILHGDAADFERVHVDLPRRVAQVARNAGVAHLVHVSALSADVGAPSNYLRSKAAGEAALRDSGVPLSVLRPSVVFGAEDSFLNLFAQMQVFLPVIPLAGAGARFQPVWVRDVAEALWRCVDRGATTTGVYEAAGPQVFTLAELVRLAGRRSGRARPVWALPHALACAQAWLLEHLPGPTLMSRDNLRSLQVDTVATGRVPGLEALGIQPASIEQAWAEEGGGLSLMDQLLRWRAAHRDA